MLGLALCDYRSMRAIDESLQNRKGKKTLHGAMSVGNLDEHPWVTYSMTLFFIPSHARIQSFIRGWGPKL